MLPEPDLNWIAVVVAIVACYVLGAFWYGLFSKPWMDAVGKTKEEIDAAQKAGGMAGIYGTQFVASALLMVTVAYWVVSVLDAGTLAEGVVGALALVPIAVLASSGDFLYESRGLKLFLINSGYRVAGLLLTGAIVGAWQ